MQNRSWYGFILAEVHQKKKTGKKTQDNIGFGLFGKWMKKGDLIGKKNIEIRKGFSKVLQLTNDVATYLVERPILTKISTKNRRF
jgi:hypothetical protein